MLTLFTCRWFVVEQKKDLSFALFKHRQTGKYFFLPGEEGDVFLDTLSDRVLTSGNVEQALLAMWNNMARG